MLSVRVLENRSIGLTEQFPTSAALKTWDGRLVSDGDWLELPRGALLDNSDKGLVRLVFVAFDRLEDILQPKGDPVCFTREQFLFPLFVRLMKVHWK